ncbi:hypothetical protein [Actinoplanes sp. N902-109]|uniref:hypothetical protein n=1 Tax=Actinoplanes sp. (strain N902-109) TaxID=649831 RepID=UPI0012FC4858|nr:hypothetical protein [Actinoplanes sp. N902-109]
MKMFGKTGCDVPGDAFSDALDEARNTRDATHDLNLDAADLRALFERFKRIVTEHTGHGLPPDPESSGG